MPRPVFDTYAGAPADFVLAVGLVLVGLVALGCCIAVGRLSNRIRRHESLTHSAKTRIPISEKRAGGKHIGISDPPAPYSWEAPIITGEDPGNEQQYHYVGDGCPGGHEGTAEAFGLGEGDTGPAGARHG